MAKINDTTLWNQLRSRTKIGQDTTKLRCDEPGCKVHWDFLNELSYWSGPHEVYDHTKHKYVGKEHLQKSWEKLDEVVAHLKDTHGISECEYCGRFISYKGLKRHRKGVECISQQRAFHLEQDGYVDVTSPYIREIKQAIESKHLQLRSQADWTDVVFFRWMRDEAQKSEDAFLDALHIECYRSEYKKNAGWQEAYWADVATATFLKLARDTVIRGIRKNTRKLGDVEFCDEWLRLANEWIDHPEGREAMLGCMELALDV